MIKQEVLHMHTSVRKKENFLNRVLKKDWQMYSLMLIPLIYFIIFKYGPLLGNIIAFRKYVPGGHWLGQNWVGLRYFEMLIYDPGFWNVFKNTLAMSLLSLVFGFPMPIILALLLNEVRNSTYKKIVQTTSYIPHFLSSVVIAAMVMETLSPSTGVINNIVKSFGYEPISFLSQPGWFRPIYIVTNIWQETGFSSIMYLGALAGINTELYESAQIDGANRWKQMLHITLPGIMPTIIILLILKIGNLLAVGSEKILLLYNPLIYETADVIGTFVYRNGLESNNYSYATAVGLFEAVIGFFLVYTANMLSKKVSETSLW